MKRMLIGIFFGSELLIASSALGTAAATDASPSDQPPAALTATARAWKDTGEFSIVSANGNSRATTTSAKETFDYNWTKALLELTGSGLGSSSGHQVTSEQYSAGEKVRHALVGDNFVFEQFRWDKNRFAGIQSQYSASGGVGRTLFTLPKDKLTSELGGGYTFLEHTDATRDDFPSGRAYAKYVHMLSPTASFTQDAEYLHNFNDRKDYRLNTETAVIASLTTHLSLKAAYTWKRVAEPPAGFGKDDTITSVALLVNY